VAYILKISLKCCLTFSSISRGHTQFTLQTACLRQYKSEKKNVLTAATVIKILIIQCLKMLQYAWISLLQILFPKSSKKCSITDHFNWEMYKKTAIILMVVWNVRTVSRSIGWLSGNAPSVKTAHMFFQSSVCLIKIHCNCGPQSFCCSSCSRPHPWWQIWSIHKLTPHTCFPTYD